MYTERYISDAVGYLFAFHLNELAHGSYIGQTKLKAGSDSKIPEDKSIISDQRNDSSFNLKNNAIEFLGIITE